MGIEELVEEFKFIENEVVEEEVVVFWEVDGICRKRRLEEVILSL